MKHTHEELRALCDAATQGNWKTFIKDSQVGEEAGEGICVVWRVLPELSDEENAEGRANARFIAATDPPTVRALLDDIERLQCQRGIETRLTLGERKKIIGDIFKDGWTVNDLTKCEAFYNSVQRYLKEFNYMDSHDMRIEHLGDENKKAIRTALTQAAEIERGDKVVVDRREAAIFGFGEG